LSGGIVIVNGSSKGHAFVQAQAKEGIVSLLGGDFERSLDRLTNTREKAPIDVARYVPKRTPGDTSGRVAGVNKNEVTKAVEHAAETCTGSAVSTLLVEQAKEETLQAALVGAEVDHRHVRFNELDVTLSFGDSDELFDYLLPS